MSTFQSYDMLKSLTIETTMPNQIDKLDTNVKFLFKAWSAGLLPVY